MVGAERRHLGHLGIDVDELMVAGRFGELVDPLLADLEPLAAADGFSGLGLQLLRGHAALLLSLAGPS
jgi:hypothetical protein